LGNFLFRLSVPTMDKPLFRQQHGGIYTYAGNEACKYVYLQKSTEVEFCV
jgi:hypothetical protein